MERMTCLWISWELRRKLLEYSPNGMHLSARVTNARESMSP